MTTATITDKEPSGEWALSPPEALPDRRSHRRHTTPGLRGNMHCRTRVGIVNISLAGIAVESAEPLAIDRLYQLKVYRGDQEIRVEARVVWCRLGVSRRSQTGEPVTLYQAGLEFEGMSDNLVTEKAKQLLGFLTVGERRVFERFKFSIASPVDLDYDQRFEVKNLSLGGMLIETNAKRDKDEMLDLELEISGCMMELQGRVVRIEFDEESDQESARLGVDFHRLDRKKEKALLRFITTQRR